MASKRNWNKTRSILNRSHSKYTYYFGNYTYDDCTKGKIAGRIPISTVGWGKRAVEVRANKTQFDKFENDTLGLNEILAKYKVIDAFDKLKDDILVCGCGFLALAGDRVMPFTAEEATGTYNWHDQNLREGVAIFREDTDKELSSIEIPDSYIEYSGQYTIMGENGEETVFVNPTGRPLIALLTHRSTAKRPFGHTVLTKPARNAIVDASRTIRQAMISAHYYNRKVDVILGADVKTDIEKMDTAVGDMLKVAPNDNGQIPQIGEFAQHAMAPFDDTIMIAARNFCSDTKLSLANLGISTSAPQSAEALEIVNDDLKDSIVEWQKELGEQLKYFAVTLWMYDNNQNSIDENVMAKIDATVPVWRSVYREDVSKFGDGISKIAQLVPGIIKSRSVWHNIGLTSDEIDELVATGNQNRIQL